MYDTALMMLKTIEDKGFKAYIVGGYPRDLLVNRTSLDIDICTDATPKELKNIFKGIILPKEQYGSVTVIYKNIHFDITTFRQDIRYADNRRPVKIKYIKSLIEDLKRRDFTINTICMDKNGNILDLLNSRKELVQRIIKTVGKPHLKIKEDSLRILRAIRFATILDFELETELKEAIKKYGYLLKKLSYYRKKEELEKIFSSHNARKGIELIQKLELEGDLELKNLDKLVLTKSIIGIWAQLDVVNTYMFSNYEKESIIKINELLDKDILNNWNLYKYDLYLLTVAGEIKGIDKTVIHKKYNQLVIKNTKEIAIKPMEICHILNKKPGVFLKDIMDELEYNIVMNKLENEYSELERFIQAKY